MATFLPNFFVEFLLEFLLDGPLELLSGKLVFKLAELLLELSTELATVSITNVSILDVRSLDGARERLGERRRNLPANLLGDRLANVIEFLTTLLFLDDGALLVFQLPADAAVLDLAILHNRGGAFRTNVALFLPFHFAVGNGYQLAFVLEN